MDLEAISKRIYHWTNGYPFLVSKICKTIDEDIMPTKASSFLWSVSEVEEAVKQLIIEKNTLFDDMTKNLGNNIKLYEYVQSIVLGQGENQFVATDPLIDLAFMYGFIAKTNSNLIKIHNKIFGEVLTNHFVSINKRNKKSLIINSTQELFLKDNGNLNFDLVLLKFQEGVKAKYSNKDIIKSDEFLEDNLRMIFLMYLQPIINGVGFSYKEVEIGAEKRLDVIVIFKNEKFIVELKIWHGEKLHEKGKAQLKKYMEIESINKGYMLILNKNKEKEFTYDFEDDIMMVYV
jgi:hypothetical protein